VKTNKGSVIKTLDILRFFVSIAVKKAKSDASPNYLGAGCQKSREAVHLHLIRCDSCIVLLLFNENENYLLKINGNSCLYAL
jgi:hypothetical protein